jgi:thioredoxin-like negative regulator of GroEL
MESVLAQLARREHTRLRVSRVDAERMAKLAERFAVVKIPTLLLLLEGRPVARLEGRATGPQIERMLEAHLPPSMLHRTLDA